MFYLISVIYLFIYLFIVFVCSFLANVDPIDVARCTEGLKPEETLIVIISKTFTTAETILNAKTLKQWLASGIPGENPNLSKIFNKGLGFRV